MKAPLFTIATVTYNSGVWLRDCVQSILDSSFSDFELLISDDCSLDDSWAVIQEFKDSRITCFRNEKNLGEYKNRNKLLSKATGKYFLFVDGDDKLYKDSLQILAQHTTNFPQAVSIYGIDKICLPDINVPKLLMPEEAYRWIYSFLIPIVYVGFAETLFKTSVLKQVGGFPEIYDCGDTFIKKLLPAYGPVLIIGDNLQYWRTSDNQASARLTKNLLGYQNDVKIDKAILSAPPVISVSKDIKIYQENMMVRNMKLLFSHTVLKLKFLRGFQLFKKLDFKIWDLKYLFRKAKLENYN